MKKLHNTKRGNVDTLIPKHNQNQANSIVTSKSPSISLSSVTQKPSNMTDNIKSAFTSLAKNVGVNVDTNTGIVKLKGINDPIDIFINGAAKVLGFNNKSIDEIIFNKDKEIQIHLPVQKLTGTGFIPLKFKPKGSTIEYTILPKDIQLTVDNFRCMFKLESRHNAAWSSLLYDLVDASYTKQHNTYSKMLITLDAADEDVYLPAAALVELAIYLGYISYK